MYATHVRFTLQEDAMLYKCLECRRMIEKCWTLVIDLMCLSKDDLQLLFLCKISFDVIAW